LRIRSEEWRTGRRRDLFSRKWRFVLPSTEKLEMYVTDIRAE
jgi:hypothetical protein